MLLFHNDWSRFGGAIVDYQTKNESFKRMVSLYHQMGIRNCLWPLALLQPQLQGVDPHSKDLTEEQKVAIGVECRFNFWYYLREVVRLPPVAGPEPVPYIANRGNLALSWAFLNNIDIALVQPRQTGKSASTDCIIVWLLYIGANNTVISLLTKDHTLRTKNVERLKKIRDNLPDYLINLSNRDSDNQTDLTCLANANTYITGVSQNSESAATNLGRGLTSPITHIDEGPYIRFIGTTMPAALASGVAAREEAKKYNKPYGNIFTTTAGKKDDRDGRYMYNLFSSGAVWNEIFLDAEEKDALLKLVKRNCIGRKTIINATFSHRQLGKTDEWLYEAMSVAGAQGEEADRDFFNVWTSGTQSSPLTTELNETIRQSEKDPVYSEVTRDSYIIRWYHTPEELAHLVKTTNFTLGLDTSDAIGRDSIAMVFTNTEDLSVVGAATINETNLIRFARFLADVMIRYPNTILIPERKSSGQAIIDSLLIHLPKAGIDPFKRIYNTIVDHNQEKEREYQEIQMPESRRSYGFYDRFKKSFGFNTTGSSRETLYSAVLQNAAKEAAHLVKDKVLSGELRGLIVKNGRIDHSHDSHDDSVVAWLLSHWFLTHSKNLSYYGIDTRKALTRVNHATRTLTPEEEWEIEEQQCIKEEIDHLVQRITQTNDEFLVAQYESRLMALNGRLKVDDSEAYSIDALLEQAREQREYNNRRKALRQRRMSSVRYN